MPTQQNPFDIKTAPEMTAAQAAPAPQIAAAPTAQTGAATVQQAAAQQAAVDPATQTVQGQLAGILASGSPLLVQAQTRAKQEANNRGLLNSSMAVGAGESALYDAALPIASQDADTHARFGLTNAEMAQQTSLQNAAETNTSNRFNVGESNVAARQTADQQFDASSQNAQLSQQTALENARLQQQAAAGNQKAQTDLMLQQMDADTRVEMVNIEANYRTLMQASQSASDLYQQTLKNISDITLNKDLDAAAKNAAIARQKELLQNGMNLIGSMNNLGIDDLVNFGPSTPTQEPVMPTTPEQNAAPDLEYWER